MTDSHVHDHFWIKAKLFLNRAMDPSDDRSDDERQLWASLSLELLGKAALSRVSPALIADIRNSNDGGDEMLKSVGLLRDGEFRFVSAQASTIFSRCAKAFRPFSYSDAKNIVGGRNDYLHGAAIGFTRIPVDAWWAQFWRQADILVAANEKTMADLVGSERVGEVEEHLQRNADMIEDRYELLTAAATRSLELYRTNRMSAPQRAEWEARDLRLQFPYSDATSCPNCDAMGWLQGDDILETEAWPMTDDDGNPMSTALEGTIVADYFMCPTCHLVLDRVELLEQAGLPQTFLDNVDPADAYEPDYGND